MIGIFSKGVFRATCVNTNRQHCQSLPLRFNRLHLSRSSSLPPSLWIRQNSRSLIFRPKATSSQDHEASSPSILSQRIDGTPKSRSLIDRIEPYLGLSRVRAPIGSVLLFLPCGSSLALAASSVSAAPQLLLYQTCLFGLGAFVMRGAGCTINDLWDRSIDKQVLRTQFRPLASGSISVPSAIGWLGFQLSIGLAILLQLNVYSILLGASSLSLVFIYPLMKRITYWPQLVLGLAFNWGALLGSSAILGQVDWKVALPLYLGHTSWTIVYDTIYGLQDKKSDVLAGVKSTALLFGPRPEPILTGFSATFVALTAMTGFMNGCGMAFYSFAVIAPAIHLSHLLKKLQPDNPDSCHAGFKASAITGSLVWFGCLLDYFLRVFQV